MKYFAVFVLLVEAVLSHTPGSASSKQSQALSRWSGVDEGLLRKLAHVLLFLVLSVCAGLGFGWQGIMVVCVWSVLDEVTKIWVRGRHCSAVDIGLNLLGTGIGVILYVVL